MQHPCQVTESRIALLEPLESRTHFTVVTGGAGRNTDVAISVTSISAESLRAGSTLNVTTLLTNTGNRPVNGRTISIRGLVSTDKKLSANDRVLINLSRRVNLQPGGTRQIPLRINLPRDLAPRSYHFIASLNPGSPDARKGNNTFRYTPPISILRPAPAPGKVDLSLAFASALPTSFPYGIENPVFFNLRNRGTADLTKPIKINLYASPDDVFGNGNDILLRGLTFNQRLKPNATVKLNAAFTTPVNFNTGFYYVAAKADVANVLAEPNEKNNITISKQRVHF